MAPLRFNRSLVMMEYGSSEGAGGGVKKSPHRSLVGAIVYMGRNYTQSHGRRFLASGFKSGWVSITVSKSLFWSWRPTWSSRRKLLPLDPRFTYLRNRNAKTLVASCWITKGRNTSLPVDVLRIEVNQRYSSKLDEGQTSNMIKFAVTYPKECWATVEAGHYGCAEKLARTAPSRVYVFISSCSCLDGYAKKLDGTSTVMTTGDTRVRSKLQWQISRQDGYAEKLDEISTVMNIGDTKTLSSLGEAAFTLMVRGVGLGFQEEGQCNAFMKGSTRAQNARCFPQDMLSELVLSQATDLQHVARVPKAHPVVS
ncbi:hypothetical protein BU16DRAFT_545391 [Lophium mytilinum]|uniref:Uncharacterized protein n=1 Tax=Lophium mytilinum TaxID=390894 RepID=A0A6A6Q8W1_9PEZI|nr:hypothetical protein BU16DRAFT_545391 [Lophium mytilinum]